MAARIVLLGPPASGKGTQGRLLAEDLGLGYFSTGKQLRREVDAGSDLGKEAAPWLEEGRYVPDELAVALALGWLAETGGGWVLDGFPRTVRQAEDLDGFLGARHEKLHAVLLAVDPEELERRVAERRECSSCSWTGTREEAGQAGRCPACGGEIRQRADDALANFRKRLRAFDELTGPVADYYERSGRLRPVDGAGAPEEVFRRVQHALRHD